MIAGLFYDILIIFLVVAGEFGVDGEAVFALYEIAVGIGLLLLPSIYFTNR